MSDSVAVILLTFNSADVIERTVRAAQAVSANVICVDSHSTDGTPELLRRLGCEVHTRAFKHYADQRNWAIQTLGNAYSWQLHLDADEVLDAKAIAALEAALRSPGAHVGFLLKRLTYFMGKPLRFAGEKSWHLRLFQSGRGACEDRLYDQHFTCDGPVARLSGLMHDLNASSLAEWTARHNRWSDLEVRELRKPAALNNTLEARLSHDPRKRRRLYKGLYYRLPHGWRAVSYFMFRFVLQLGFLDGRAGFYYVFLQSLWFRMLVDAKLSEARLTDQTTASPPSQAIPSSALQRPVRDN
ncbi:MAG: glycosyltransferase family 2 protein [Gammaproteobacteria bacterium]|nr:glycosyltransferase family 2 protein [Gammaproteobacteria bacterium]